jgi:ligand-binding sensor domain-containing protein
VDRYTGEIERIVPDENDLLGLMSKTHAFLVDRSGILWIATANGLFSHDRKSGLFFKEDAGGLLESNMPVCCLELGEQRLWLGSQGALVSLDLSGQEQHLSIELSAGRLVEDLLIDRQNQLWIQTDQALLMLPPNGQELQKVLDSRGSTNSLALKNVKPLVEDQEGQIWFGTFEDGVYQIDPSSLDMKHYLHNPADPGSLAENSINCIFEDRSGTMWFGTFGAGISILDPLANQFGLLKHNPFNPNSLSSSFIWTIMEDRDGHLWMGTNTAGISVMDPRTETYTHYQHDPSKPFSLGHLSYQCLHCFGMTPFEVQPLGVCLG